MSNGADDEILQDFLIEAGEILEKLNGQLVEMEQRPDDRDLLNAVFRSFHTVKGGASFLNLTPLVEVCHRAEDVFNVLRNGQRQVDAHLMDAVLRVLDIVNDMFAQIQHGEEMVPAEPALLTLLESLAQPGGGTTAPVAAAAPAAVAPATPAAAPPAADGDITDSEFEALLDAMQADAPASAAAPVVESEAESAAAPAGGEISDDEFERLLDDLHGAKPIGATTAAAPASAATATSPANEMSDDEFEKLLDQLHGGKPPGKDMPAAGAGTPPPPTPPAPVPAVAVKAAPPPAPPAAVKPSAAPQPPAAETTVRVDTKRLDTIMNLVGELVLVRNRLSTLKAAMNDEQLAKAVGNLDLVTSDLQSAVMKTRMQPIKKVFGRFPRVVRDLARSLNKEVNLELQGEETDLDKNLVEALADPLVHLVRNSVDHGVEMPDAREKAGKPRAGTVVLAAEQEGDHILLTIEDDGGGMDPEVLRRKVVEKGLMDADSAARLEDRECYNLIFMPGFSTKTEISDVSGRGVGMDVVKTRITQLNGTVEIDSKKGRGTIIRIKVPLTLAIMPTLMVKVDSRTFALPLSSVSEIFPLDTSHTNRIDGQLVIMVRNRAMPLFYLCRWLSTGDGDQNAGQVVMVHVGNQRVGFVVDHVLGQEEVVIKPLGAMLTGMPGFSGATITGDGRIALILDVPSLMKAYARRM